MNDKAILDTSPLICLYQLNLLEYLNLFFNKVYIPREVEREFLEKNSNKEERERRYKFLTEFYYKHSSWFIQCNLYSDDLILIYKTKEGIDSGEAEVFAQNQALGSGHLLLIDEMNARNLATKLELTFNGVLFIIAIMEIRFSLCNYVEVVNRLKTNYGFHLNERIIQIVYQQAKTFFK